MMQNCKCRFFLETIANVDVTPRNQSFSPARALDSRMLCTADRAGLLAHEAHITQGPTHLA